MNHPQCKGTRGARNRALFLHLHSGSDNSVIRFDAGLPQAAMRKAIARVLLCLALLPVSSTPTIAQGPGPVRSSKGYGTTGHQLSEDSALLTFDDGLDILGAALESRRHLSPGADCSHFVHAIYERAGFPYPYSNSTELYAGIDQFQPVTRPQPGDLVAWRGHVGIVVSSVKRSFFSALRSGRGVERYDSAYWRAHGSPRFFRYVKDRYESARAYPGPDQPAD